MNLKLLKSSRPAVGLQGDEMDQVMADLDMNKFEDELATQETIGNFEYVPAHKLTDSELDKINRKREVIKEKIEVSHTEIKNLEGKIESIRENIANYELNDRALASAQDILAGSYDGLIPSPEAKEAKAKKVSEDKEK